jgi:hypothetical protein
MTASNEPRRTSAASDKPRCGAKKRQGEDGETCTQMAGWGTEHPGTGHCKLHGGNTRNQRVAAANEIAEREVRAALAELDVRPVDDPLTALLQLGGQAIAWQETIAGIVNELEGRIRYAGANGAEQLRAEVALYERAMDRTAHIIGLIARLNIEERLTRIAEQQAERVLAAIDEALACAGVVGEPAVQARLAAARHLAAVPDVA